MDLVVKHGAREARVHLEKTEAGYRLKVDDTTYDVDVAQVGEDVRSLLID